MKHFSKLMLIAVGSGILTVALSLVPVSLISAAQDIRPAPVRVSGVYEGQLLTSGDKIYARVPAESIGVEFLFQPETIGDVQIPANHARHGLRPHGADLRARLRRSALRKTGLLRVTGQATRKT